MLYQNPQEICHIHMYVCMFPLPNGMFPLPKQNTSKRTFMEMNFTKVKENNRPRVIFTGTKHC